MTRRSTGHDSNRLQQLWRTFPLAWRLLQDRQVAPLLKAIPLLALLYVLVPVDLIPDVIPIGGQLDDLAVVLIALRMFIRLVPPDIVARYDGEDGGDTVLDDDNVVDGTWRSVESDRWEK